MDIRLDGKIALVTGASSGLGERFALALAASGASVALAARRVDKLDALKKRIDAAGGRAYVTEIDVTSVASIEQAVRRTEVEFGDIDILVNNSGVSITKRLGEYTEADYDYILDTNAKGAFFVAQTVGVKMMRRRTGKIINIASAVGIHAVPGIGVYAMSKAAVIHMTKAMAREWGRFGINVNAICPGYIETEINREFFQSEAGQKLMQKFPRQRAGKPEDLDGMLVLLASDRSGFVNGAPILLDDGLTLG
jgi:NAD(P)-dependent dehydrogenase (short-subunit alcohol dehydrogenase family)